MAIFRRRRKQREGARFRYSAWDGTQTGFDLDADGLFKELTDDLLYHGDLNAALRRLMQQGFEDAEGNRWVYDINGTSNYNASVEARHGVSGMGAVAELCARLLRAGPGAIQAA